MPELPEVETMARQLRRALAGGTVEGVEVHCPGILRPGGPKALAALRGLAVTGVGRRGKLLILELSGGWRLVFHLKMTGQPVVNDRREPGRHCRFIIRGRNRRGRPFFLHYNDIRRFGRVYLQRGDTGETRHPLKDLGPEAPTIGRKALARVLEASRSPLKPLLLDQTKIAGIGNIYADEILHRSRLHPLTPARTLTKKQLDLLHRNIRGVLRRAIVMGGSSVRNYVRPSGKKGTFQEEHAVYGRRGRPCPACGTPIERAVIRGRGTHFCPSCQLPPDAGRAAQSC